MKWWPFNRKPAMPFAEFVKTLPPAPCGNQYGHYEWTHAIEYACPHCAGIANLKKRDADETRMADLIANAVAKRLKERAHG